MGDSFRFWFGYFAIVAGILFVGWNEPIRYRFMSQKEISLEESPIVVPTPIVRERLVARNVEVPVPVPETAPSPTPHWMWDPNRKTQLDRPPYNQNYGSGYYYYNRYATPRPY